MVSEIDKMQLKQYVRLLANKNHVFQETNKKHLN